MLKRKLTKALWEALSDEKKALYTVSSSNADEYLFTGIEGGLDDAGELRRANERIKTELAEAKKAAADAQTALDAVGADARRKAGDITAIEADWQRKVDTEKAKAKADTERLTKHLNEVMINAEANRIASVISTSPALLSPLIAKRLSAELDGETPITRVLGPDGKPSAMSIKELQQEFVDNKEYSGILIGSKGSGGADGRRMDGSSSSGAGGTTLEDFNKMGDKARLELFKSNPDTFKQLSEEARLAVRRM